MWRCIFGNSPKFNVLALIDRQAALSAFLGSGYVYLSKFHLISQSMIVRKCTPQPQVCHRGLLIIISMRVYTAILNLISDSQIPNHWYVWVHMQIPGKIVPIFRRILDDYNRHVAFCARLCRSLHQSASLAYCLHMSGNTYEHDDLRQ